MRQRLFSFLLLSAIATSSAGPLGAQAQETVSNSGTADRTAVQEMGKQVVGLYRAGKYEQAMELGLKALEAAERMLGPLDPEVGHALYRLSNVYRVRGQIDAAEASARSAIASFERAYGGDHPDVAIALSALGSALSVRGDLAGDESAQLRALAILEKALPPDHADIAIPLLNLGSTYFQQGKFTQAEPLYTRAVAIREKALGATNSQVAASRFNLAIVKWKLGDFIGAQDLLKQAIAATESSLGPEHPAVGNYLDALAGLYRELGRETEVESLHLRALKILEKTFGAQHQDVAKSVINLGNLYFQQARYELAEPKYKRAIEIYESINRPNQVYAYTALLNLASVYIHQGRLSEAEPLIQRGLTIKEKELGPDHPEVASTIYNLALLRYLQHRNDEAEPLLLRAIAIYEKRAELRDQEATRAIDQLSKVLTELGRHDAAEQRALQALALREEVQGPNHPDVADSLITVADALAVGRGHAAAEPLYERALSIRRQMWGAISHSSVAESFGRMALTSYALGRVDEALDHARNSTAILKRRFTGAGPTSAATRTEQSRYATDLAFHVRLLDEAQSLHGATLVDESLRVAQLIRASDTASQVARMASRYATGSDQLSGLVRQRQDLERQLARAESDLMSERSAASAVGDSQRVTALRNRLSERQMQLDTLDASLRRAFPQYEELVDARPLGVTDIQALLAGDEALVSILVTPDTGFVWVVSRNKVVFRRLQTNAKQLAQAVQQLRSHLNPADSLDALGRPFPLSTAYQLYRTLFGPVEDTLRNIRHLIVVPDGALQSLPLAVLVTAPPASNQERSDLARVAWLIKRHALTVLPAESSLRALRTFAKGPAGRAPFRGFGDPLLEGTPGTRGPALAALRSRGAVASADDVRKLPRLPETAAELQAIASSLKAPAGAVFLRDKATETHVKNAKLDGFRTLAFATHGLVAGDLQGLAEPALVLTPPATASEADDGLLTASEIAQLQLNADWVVLSACNTAADDGTPGAEGLSGLSKAFFYAGARSLLVSHWPVNSNAAVVLTTTMFKNYARGASKASALQYSMLQFMQRKAPRFSSHPMMWAPFVMVGEGNRDWARTASKKRRATTTP